MLIQSDFGGDLILAHPRGQFLQRPIAFGGAVLLLTHLQHLRLMRGHHCVKQGLARLQLGGREVELGQSLQQRRVGQHAGVKRADLTGPRR